MEEPADFLYSAITPFPSSALPPASASSDQPSTTKESHQQRPNSSDDGHATRSLAKIGPQHPASSQTKTRNQLDEYEVLLSKVRWAARFVSSAYNLSTFLAFCNLTWATVVLLGAFVDDIQFFDYAMVTALLILEAFRLGSAAFFTILLTHGLARSSQNPEHIIHGRDDQYRRSFLARILSSLLQALLIAPSFICPLYRFRGIPHRPTRTYISLLVFYLTVICNAVVSCITLVLSTASFVRFRDRQNQGVMRYYDELVQRGITVGVIQADEFEFIQFAYGMLGKEYARIIQPEAVIKNHRKLIEYLYHHRLGQDFLLTFLDDGDAFVQQAAVNMPGFWADPTMGLGLKGVKLSNKVLEEMANKVGIGQVGWAAINSFGGIARNDPQILARTRMSNGRCLLDKLADLVDARSSGSLAAVRTLALFYHYSYECDSEKQAVCPILQNEQGLVGRLNHILRSAKVHRLRLFSAYLLHLMRRLDPSCYKEVDGITPTKDSYWFVREFELLNFVRKQCDLNAVLHNNLPENFLRNGSSFKRPDGTRLL
ncbi:hypothetical protein KP509_12G090500 [Ceratopteris richardii]|uniref:Uncharacterized protein n=1 Tax=Ceratopteris richardii TaxID=49495 RepID=A0A8T2TRR1_CERRI|nr:hypothetical protein KP509_12G090500 [Ceratopteris richardii]